MDYWLIANGRRFILVVKVSGLFFCIYNGFILPYGSSAEYPYPLYISGTASSRITRFSVGNHTISNCWMPTATATVSSALYRDLDGSWVFVESIANSSGNAQYRGTAIGRNVITPYDARNFVGNNADGSYGLIQTQLIMRETENFRLEGVLEGIQYVAGFANASEDTIQPVGYPNDFLVVQNTDRTNIEQFAAIELG